MLSVKPLTMGIVFNEEKKGCMETWREQLIDPKNVQYAEIYILGKKKVVSYLVFF